jgi:RNA polymerase sigma-70 factor (ECF subfamily)
MERGLTQEEAATRFYAYLWPHRATVLRTAQFLAGNAADADDLAQETLMRAFRNVARFDPAGNAKGWLTTILRHIVIDRSRVRASALVADALPLEDLSVPAARPMVADKDPEDVAALLEEFSDQALIGSLKGLPEDLCWTLLLVDVQQMSYEEAAEVMDVPPGTVKSRAHRGRGLLRDRLLNLARAAHETNHASGEQAGWRKS